MKYPNLIEHFEMIMAHVQDESYAEAVATIATFKNRLVELEEKLSEFQNGLPIEKAKEGRKWVLAKFKDELPSVTFAQQYEGRWMVIRHGGFSEDGYDFAWGFTGVGGFSDECFEKILTLPSTETKEGE